MAVLNRRERSKRRGKRKWQLLAKSQLLSRFASFESQAAIGTKGRTEITIAGEVVTLPSSFPSFASVQCLPFLKGVAHATRILRLKHGRFEQKGTKQTKGEKEVAITGQAPTALPICFFDSQVATQQVNYLPILARRTRGRPARSLRTVMSLYCAAATSR